MNFIPPMSERENDELIVIANGTTDKWQQEAIDQATLELIRRGINVDRQRARLSEIERENEFYWREEYARRENEDYGWLDKIAMTILWPKALLQTILYHRNLKKEGYILKAKRRKQLIVLGFLLTLLALQWEEMKWNKKEAERLKAIDTVQLPDSN